MNEIRLVSNSTAYGIQCASSPFSLKEKNDRYEKQLKGIVGIMVGIGNWLSCAMINRMLVQKLLSSKVTLLLPTANLVLIDISS